MVSCKLLVQSANKEKIVKRRKDINMSNYAVVIKSKSMGTADKALAENLLLGFIHVLSEADKLPTHILLYGEGVKMTCKGSSAIDDFKVLEEKGVEILSCGTCLDYYEIKDELEAGKVTTMADTVRILSETDKIVTP